MGKPTLKCPMCQHDNPHIKKEDKHGYHLRCKHCGYEWRTLKDFNKIFK